MLIPACVYLFTGIPEQVAVTNFKQTDNVNPEEDFEAASISSLAGTQNYH